MRLFRISNILFLGCAVFLGVLLFWTSQAVQQKENRLFETRQRLEQETETLRVLAVEWDYLTRPQRLEELAAELGMKKPASAEMVRSADEIPEPVIVNIDPRFTDESMAQNVSLAAPPAQKKPVPAAVSRDPVLSPSQAEKQSFDRLIETLNGGEAP